MAMHIHVQKCQETMPSGPSFLSLFHSRLSSFCADVLQNSRSGFTVEWGVYHYVFRAASLQSSVPHMQKAPSSVSGTPRELSKTPQEPLAEVDGTGPDGPMV